MTVVVHGDGGPDADWWIEVPLSYPDEVRAAAQAITDAVRSGLRGQPRTASLINGLEAAKRAAAKNAGEPTEPMRKKLHAQAHELLLLRQDRIDLAEMLLNRDIGSWSELTFDETARLLDAMEGYLLIRHIRCERHGVTTADGPPGEPSGR